jgi:hypothetical protein
LFSFPAVQRSQSTQSKRSSNLSSVRERSERSESIYVNTDIIKELIAEESTGQCPTARI